MIKGYECLYAQTYPPNSHFVFSVFSVIFPTTYLTHVVDQSIICYAIIKSYEYLHTQKIPQTVNLYFLSYLQFPTTCLTHGTYHSTHY